MRTVTPGVVFAPNALLPGAWRGIVGSGPVRMFNPGLLADRGGWLFAYRVVAADGLRRIALCRLDHDLNVLAGSPLPLSDYLRIRADAIYPGVARQWFADPRLYRIDGRLFVYWNSGWHEPQNYQFIQELDATSLLPIGEAREFVLRDGRRRKLEKNWTLFQDAAGECFAIYSVSPHRVLRFALAGRDVVFEDCATTDWAPRNYPASHGGLRGSAPPQRAHDSFLSFCHSVHGDDSGYTYAAAAYRFKSTAPFTPTHAPRTHLRLHNPYGAARLNPALNTAVSEVLYPCGAARDGSRWLVSHGINDEHCAISILSDAEIEAHLEPVLTKK